MPLRPEPPRAGAALARLEGLRGLVAEAEDDVLACLVVTGEPRPQRVLDDWLDQVADTLRALGEAAADLEPPLAGWAVDAGADDERPRTVAHPHAVRSSPTADRAAVEDPS